VAQYLVKVLAKGKSNQVDIEAKNEADARIKASRYGSVVSVEHKKRRMSGLSYSDRQTMMIRLAAMLASGVGAGEALKIMRGAFSGRIKDVSHDLLVKVESGMDLPTAFESIGRPHFSENMTALIKAGSVAGSTANAMREAIAFDREMKEIGKSAAKGIGNAIFSFILSAVIIIATVFYGLPMIMESDLMKMGGSKSVDLGWAITMSNVVGGFMVIVTFIALTLVFVGTIGKNLAPSAADAFIVRIPFYRDLILAQKNYIAFNGLALLVRSGVRMENALALTAKTTPPGALRKDFIAAAEAVKSGQKWALVMKTIHETDRVALSASLDREQVANSLRVISDQYKEIYSDRISVFVPTMQVISALCMTLAGFIMFAMTTLPMLQMTEGILG